MKACSDQPASRARPLRLLELLFYQAVGLSDGDAGLGLTDLASQLTSEATDRICGFLGHPRQCPHHQPIPPGPCCVVAGDEAGSAIAKIVPLTEVRVGEACEVVMIRPRGSGWFDRLGSFGIVPGSKLRILQKRPAYVVQAGHTDLALDAGLARHLLVRKIS